MARGAVAPVSASACLLLWLFPVSSFCCAHLVLRLLFFFIYICACLLYHFSQLAVAVPIVVFAVVASVQSLRH